MARLTNSQLLSELEAARVEIQRLSAENETLKADAAKRPAAKPQRRVYTPSATPEQERAHSAYVRALIAAREEAMRTGRTAIVRRPA